MPYKKRQMHLAAFFHRGALAALLRPKFHATSRAPVECQVLGLVESRLAHPALRTCVPRSTGTRGLRAPPQRLAHW
jgi:hypothetical protein